ncbi:GNAT family N-acetyltransferase [Burkholderia sp. AU31280]|uniref:GNAT family N-acetyltransferase n=1 Tax=Burkholderia sp. AU31280 TaxID=2015353 RepID=UPI00211AE3C6|nr:GNAT family N-acetyltransferase [Burkholderia sp. AU31280]
MGLRAPRAVRDRVQAGVRRIAVGDAQDAPRAGVRAARWVGPLDRAATKVVRQRCTDRPQSVVHIAPVDAMPPGASSMTGLSIRSATIGDAQAIADFHVKVWRHTYRDLAPAEAHAVLDEHYRRRQWNEKLSSNDGNPLVLVAEIDGSIVGIGAAGAPSDPVFKGRGEIKFLYVDPRFQRRGIGRQLLARLATHLGRLRYPGAALSVVDGNDAAIAFYAALHGRPAGEYIDPGPVWRSRNIVMVWDDLASLGA